MKLVKIYMKSGNVVEVECEKGKVITNGDGLERINLEGMTSDSGEKIMFLDLENVECITFKMI